MSGLVSSAGFGLEECAAYWQQVVDMNDHQKIAFTSSRAAMEQIFGAQSFLSWGTSHEPPQLAILEKK